MLSPVPRNTVNFHGAVKSAILNTHYPAAHKCPGPGTRAGNDRATTYLPPLFTSKRVWDYSGSQHARDTPCMYLCKKKKRKKKKIREFAIGETVFPRRPFAGNAHELVISPTVIIPQ